MRYCIYTFFLSHLYDLNYKAHLDEKAHSEPKKNQVILFLLAIENMYSWQ